MPFALTYWNGRIVAVLGALLRRAADRCDDAGVRAAATQIAAHPLANLIVGKSRRPGLGFERHCAGHSRRGFVEHRDCRADLSGRAIAALKGVVLDECGLDRVQRAALSDALDRRYPLAVVCDGEREAGIDPTSVGQHGAGAALAAIAAFFGAGKAQPVAQRIEQGHARVELEIVVGTVDVQPHGHQCRTAGRRRCARGRGLLRRRRGDIARGRDTRGQHAATAKELPARRIDGRVIMPIRRRHVRRSAGRRWLDMPVHALPIGKDIGSIYRCLKFLPDAALSLIVQVRHWKGRADRQGLTRACHAFERAICVPLAT